MSMCACTSGQSEFSFISLKFFFHLRVSGYAFFVFIILVGDQKKGLCFFFAFCVNLPPLFFFFDA
jgi:hypothetical protein